MSDFFELPAQFATRHSFITRHHSRYSVVNSHCWERGLLFTDKNRITPRTSPPDRVSNVFSTAYPLSPWPCVICCIEPLLQVLPPTEKFLINTTCSLGKFGYLTRASNLTCRSSTEFRQHVSVEVKIGRPTLTSVRVSALTVQVSQGKVFGVENVDYNDTFFVRCTSICILPFPDD
jgi:hypothetical protein